MSDEPDVEIELEGGAQSGRIVRLGSTVRRRPHRRADYVHALLRHLEMVGFEGAPRVLGFDTEGREILSFIEGEVFVGEGTDFSEERLVSAARLIRRFHDATAGTPFAEGGEVVVHTDLGPHNMVFVGDDAVGIIDWDEDVGPGSRLFDLAHAVWCYAPIGHEGGSVERQARRARIMCDAYGFGDAVAVIDEVEARLRRALADHEAAGREGGVRVFSELVAWMEDNGPALRARL